MKLSIKSFSLFALLAVFVAAGCEKKEYTFGEFKTPSDLTLTATVAGVDANNPNGNGTGNVAITVTGKNAITYKIDFGDGKSLMVPSGTINYKYNNPGTFEYVVTVNAVGTGGVTSTISKKVKVFVAFEIPALIVQNLTGGSSKIWVTDNLAPGHVGVGPANEFSPIWYAATPNQRDACLYDDEITFSKDANNNIFMSINNKGQSFSIGAATAFYGFGGGDACLGVNAAGNKKLAFMNATSGSNSNVSTGIQFEVPGNGLINFGTGGNTYEILSITATTIHLRNIGIDGNAWYQKLKLKP
jgi:hypothetical protein